jgi:hypothetical protein
MRFLSLFLIGILTLTGCKEEPVAQLVLPSGLTVSVAKSESVEGLVSVQATASVRIFIRLFSKRMANSLK